MGNITAYIILILAVVLGTASNGFAKGAQGFTLLIPSILTAITIVGCMYTLSIVMKTIPVGITYASFAGLCIIATTLVGMYKFNQMPNLYTIIGLALIIAGVLIVAVVLGPASNGFAKGAQGFTILLPSIITAITIVGCMYTLSLVMKTIPVGITYASFAGLCIIATTIVGMYKFKQIPDLYTMIGLALIIAGVLIVNLLGKAN